MSQLYGGKQFSSRNEIYSHAELYENVVHVQVKEKHAHIKTDMISHLPYCVYLVDTCNKCSHQVS